MRVNIITLDRPAEGDKPAIPSRTVKLGIEDKDGAGWLRDVAARGGDRIVLPADTPLDEVLAMFS